ncbi:MAG: hypothetical protein PHV68_03365, partial [Candidatus Gastranaerophilales bacterium]|nr:hypothetical protein [Candidatus Gastranaerophilales bacterium]
SASGGSGTGVSAEGCWHESGNWHSFNGSTKTGEINPGFILNNGSLVHIWLTSSNCTTPVGTFTRCGGISIDVNGFKKPNTWGKDIFSACIISNSLVPYGARGFNDPSITCVEGSTATNNIGAGCAAKYLYQ